jgi:hypothetical protein
VIVGREERLTAVGVDHQCAITSRHSLLVLLGNGGVNESGMSRKHGTASRNARCGNATSRTA